MGQLRTEGKRILEGLAEGASVEEGKSVCIEASHLDRTWDSRRKIVIVKGRVRNHSTESVEARNTVTVIIRTRSESLKLHQRNVDDAWFSRYWSAEMGKVVTD